MPPRPRSPSRPERSLHAAGAGTALAALCVAALTLAAAPTLHAAPEDDALRLRALAATCAQCHGTDGRPASGGTIAPGAERPSVPWHCAQVAARLRVRRASSSGAARNAAVGVSSSIASANPRMPGGA